MAWNRVDIAETEIFTEESQWKVSHFLPAKCVSNLLLKFQSAFTSLARSLGYISLRHTSDAVSSITATTQMTYDMTTLVHVTV